MSSSSHFVPRGPPANAPAPKPNAASSLNQAALPSSAQAAAAPKKTTPTMSQSSTPAKPFQASKFIAPPSATQRPPAAVFVKREAEEPLDALFAKPEAPHVRRNKIFASLAVVPTKTEAKGISSPDELTDYELKELYDIVRAAMVAQFPHRKVTPAAMEDFLKAVFEKWHALMEPPVLQDLKEFPFTHQAFSNPKMAIGTIVMDREEVIVQHWLTFTVDDELSLKLEVVRPDQLNSRKRQTICDKDFRHIKWKPAVEIAASKKWLLKHALNSVADQLATYNRVRAIRYARNMLHHQTKGTATPAPCSGRYEFASLDLVLNALPLLEKEELEKGDTTVVLFSTAELGVAFEGRNALMGKKNLKTST